MDEYRDDAGHRRPADAPFLAHLLRFPVASPLRNEAAAPDEVLWHQVALVTANREPVVINRVTSVHDRMLSPASRDIGIEVWTETELSTLHALSWLDQGKRCLDAAEFMLEEVQPDNGTNHPWAIHIFIAMEAIFGRRDAGMYAQTLLHNAMMSSQSPEAGVPDSFSALILHDAATWLAAVGTRHEITEWFERE